MDEKEFEQLLKKKENSDIEFKAELPESKAVAQLVTALYNSRGGKIILGVEDGTGKPIGLREPQKVEHRFVQIIRHWCKLDEEPKIEFVKYGGRDFVVITCPKGRSTPYSVPGETRPRVRIGSSNMPATREEIARLYREGSSRSHDTYPVENATLDDIDMRKVRAYFRESRQTVQLKGRHFFALLEKEKFVARENGKIVPTFAGIVLFGKHPSDELPYVVIRADRYRGLDVSMWIDRADIAGDAFAMVDDAEKFVLKNIRTSYTPKGFRTEVRPEYPTEALKEAIINALVHRDYHFRESILLKMFDDRIEIWSPGELLRPLTVSQIADLSYAPRSRNEVIAGVFSRKKLMDKRGTGILRMNRFCREWGLPPPEFREQSGYFVVVFRNPLYSGVTAVKPSVELNARQKRFVESGLPRISRREYASLLGCSIITAFNDLQDLVSKKVLVRRGGGKYVYYERIE